jgi:predicted lipoprotein
MEKNKRKYLKLFLFLTAGFFLLYNSVYFKKLDTIRIEQKGKRFDAHAYAQAFWEESLLPNLNKAMGIADVLPMLSDDFKGTIEKYGRTMGLGSEYYILITGTGAVTAIDNEELTLEVMVNNQKKNVTIKTGFFFGNALRDVTGLINVSDFASSRDFNDIAAELNKIAISRVISPFVENVKAGEYIQFWGVCELNPDDPQIDPLKIIPVQFRIGGGGKIGRED